MAVRTARRGSMSSGAGTKCRMVDVRSVEPVFIAWDLDRGLHGAGVAESADTRWTLLYPWRSPRLGPLASTT